MKTTSQQLKNTVKTLEDNLLREGHFQTCFDAISNLLTKLYPQYQPLALKVITFEAMALFTDGCMVEYAGYRMEDSIYLVQPQDSILKAMAAGLAINLEAVLEVTLDDSGDEDIWVLGVGKYTPLSSKDMIVLLNLCPDPQVLFPYSLLDLKPEIATHISKYLLEYYNL